MQQILIRDRNARCIPKELSDTVEGRSQSFRFMFSRLSEPGPVGSTSRTGVDRRIAQTFGDAIWFGEPQGLTWPWALFQVWVYADRLTCILCRPTPGGSSNHRRSRKLDRWPLPTSEAFAVSLWRVGIASRT